jgi:hypothetical protein
VPPLITTSSRSRGGKVARDRPGVGRGVGQDDLADVGINEKRLADRRRERHAVIRREREAASWQLEIINRRTIIRLGE